MDRETYLLNSLLKITILTNKIDSEKNAFVLLSSNTYACIMPELGLDLDGNFNIHIWACSGDFIVRNRWTGNVTAQ